MDNSINAAGDFGKRMKYRAFIAYNQFQRRKNTFFRDLTTIEDQLTQNDGDQDTSIFNNLMSRGSFFNSTKNKKINYEIGYDVNIETGIGPRILSNRQVIGDYALFSTAELRPTSKLLIRPGLRIIHNTAYAAPLIPSLNIKYDLLKNSLKKRTLTLRSSYARGFRAPDLKELYFFFVDINHNIQGNPALQAERSNNFTFALDYRFTVNEKPSSLKIQGFYNSIQNMISLAQENESLFTFFNINQFKTAGIQTSNTITLKDLTLTSGFSYIGRYNELIELNTSLSPRFLFSPEGQINAQYKFKKLNGTINLFYKYTGRLPIVRVLEDDAVDVVTVDPFNTLDISISKSFSNDRFVLTTGVKNLFNITNINGFNAGGAHSSGSNSMQIAMGRTYFLTLNIQLSKTQK
jgi:outer membrane receptor for ferrienterochelin and colicins